MQILGKSSLMQDSHHLRDARWIFGPKYCLLFQ